MKGSTMFWLAVLIAAILVGEYQLWIHRTTWVTTTGYPIFIGVTAILFVVWEIAFGCWRNGDADYYGGDEDDSYNFKEHGWEIRAITPLFSLYIFIRYYLNPFLDKILK